ncbi:MAG: hypothetical protein AAF721_42120 [Myxococcota bacterium]
MSSRVHVEPVEVADPARGAARAAAVALRPGGPTRTTLLVVCGDGQQPGLAVAPWTIDGLLSCAQELRRPALAEWIPTAGSTTTKTRIAGSSTTLRLVVPGARRAMQVPSAWVGAHALLVAPCVCDQDSGRGPTARALAALAQRCAVEPLRDPVGVGRWLCRYAFATAGVLIDATWATRCDAHETRHAATSRVLCSADLQDGPIDRESGTMAPRIGHHAKSRALAGRRIDALWQQSAPRTDLPGPFARAWPTYAAQIGKPL